MRHPKLRSMTPSVAFNFFRRLPSKVDMLLRSAIYISHSHVIIGARNTEVASEVKQSILQSTPSARINIIQIELSSLMSVRAFTEKFLAMDLPLNILINNVGVMYCPFQLSEDGIEMQFATNHVVADVILWRKKNVTVGILIGVLTSWIIFEVAGYTLLSLVSNVLLLLISILFVWAKAAEVLNRYTVVGVLSQSQADNPF
ncbi:retinol dehydrogenase 11-like isoform X1 [Zingiber officinale]|uniref:retinol dehydrogenase 11-like isoform X1 n=1 Tax=Zingiber officinale TaxID=94328 RepID=UPI001C4D94E7|nr:retinol dehydrogenase 11-like isoform X1 [Zingiber officinale]